MSLHPSNLKWLILSFVVIVFDQLTKLWIMQHLQASETIPVLAFFNLSLNFNTGAAFSFLANAGGWQLLFLSAISIMAIFLLTVWLLALKETSFFSAGAIALVMGGAAGNLVDRLRFGYVIDFLDFYYHHWHFATFNVADSSICAGAFLLLLANFFQTRKL